MRDRTSEIFDFELLELKIHSEEFAEDVCQTMFSRFDWENHLDSIRFNQTELQGK